MNGSGVVFGLLAALGVVAVAVGARRAVVRLPRVSSSAPLPGRAGSAGAVFARLWREPPAPFARAFTGVALPVAVADAWRWWHAGVALGALVSFSVGGPVLAAVVVAVAGGSPFVYASVARSRSAASYDASLASALDAIARSVRAGASLPTAVAEAAGAVRGAVADDLERVGGGIRRGQRLEAALDAWRKHRTRPSVRLATGALALAAATGGPPARVIEEVAASLRTRMQVEGEARALASQARMSALVVGVAPIGFALLSCAADSRNAHLMFGTPIGVACLLIGLSLDAVGALWMHRISETVVG